MAAADQAIAVFLRQAGTSAKRSGSTKFHIGKLLGNRANRYVYS